MATRTVYECASCFALIPYSLCNHNCQTDDEGFAEADEFMPSFVHWLQWVQTTRAVQLCVLAGPPPIDDPVDLQEELD